MKKIIVILFFFGAFSSCSQRNFTAIAELDNGAIVSMIVSPMFGFHSDWERRIVVEHNGERIEKELFEDTGWWRGSNLYRHISGAYVIHEGQMGCFGFSIEPLEFELASTISCEKVVKDTGLDKGQSRFYTEMSYLGIFIETPRSETGNPITFFTANSRTETELPDAL